MAVASAHCGGYKDDGSGAVRDAIIIKSLTNKITAGSVSYSNICGMMGISAKAVAGAGTAVAATVCCKKSFNELKGNDFNEFQIRAKIRSSKKTGARLL